MKYVLILSCLLFVLPAEAAFSPKEAMAIEQVEVKKKRNQRKRNKRYKKKKSLFKRIFKGKNQCDCPKH